MFQSDAFSLIQSIFSRSKDGNSRIMHFDFKSKTVYLYFIAQALVKNILISQLEEFLWMTDVDSVALSWPTA